MITTDQENMYVAIYMGRLMKMSLNKEEIESYCEEMCYRLEEVNLEDAVSCHIDNYFL